jgi:hypothetical protein
MKIQIFKYNTDLILIVTDNIEIKNKLKTLGYEIKQDDCFFNNDSIEVMSFIFDKTYHLLEFYFLRENIEILTN